MEKYLKLMNDNSYAEYMEAKEKGEVVFEKEYKHGCTYVKDNKSSYGIRISFEVEELESLFEDIEPYLNYDKVYVLMNGENKTILEKLSHLRVMYFAYDMRREIYDFIPYNTSLTLKEYDESEFEAFIDVLGKAFVPVREASRLEPFNWYLNNQEEARKNFEEAKNHGFYGYYSEDELVGVLGIEFNTIDMIAVKNEYQGQGIGSELLKEGINRLVARGKEYITLGVLAHNEKAIDLYKKHGFRVTGNLCVLEN